jgi:hypothetical protein
LDKAIRENKRDAALLSGLELDDSMFDEDDDNNDDNDDNDDKPADDDKPDKDQSLWVHEFAPHRYTGEQSNHSCLDSLFLTPVLS